MQRYKAVFTLSLLLVALSMAGCSSTPLQPYSTDVTPLMLAPAIQSEDQDDRGRFREIFCTVLEARKTTLPDPLGCDEALTRIGAEPAGNGVAVNLGPAQRRLRLVFVPGLGWDCFADWLGQFESTYNHLRSLGYEMTILNIDGLSSSQHNAGLIRDAILSLPEAREPDILAVGYSKGMVDLLNAITEYPEIQSRIVAVASLAGAVGGSPLAYQATADQLELMQYFPGAACESTGDEALIDLYPDTRKKWLSRHPLPQQIPFYSLITFPQPERISWILKNSYNKLAQVDPRNDSQLIFYDQFIPGSKLVAYLNADHLAIALPIDEKHRLISALFVNENTFPRDALYEALMRYIEEETGSEQTRKTP
ncbi:MAG: hypothetical protein ABW101_17455 [Candidatus Thiodiazotropha sp.]